MFCRILDVKQRLKFQISEYRNIVNEIFFLLFQISDQKSDVEVKQVTNIKQCEQCLSTLS